MNWEIREGTPEDAPDCFAIYGDAIRNGTSGRYTPAQARAWAPPDDAGEWIAARLEAGVTWIGVTPTRAEGFLTVTTAGHLDLFFVRPEARASGLASALYDRMMDWAATRGLNHLTTHASHLARSFLEARGWKMIAGEAVERNGEVLERWSMERTMGAPRPGA